MITKLEAVLAQLCAAAHTAWPQLEVEDALFCGHLTKLAGGDTELLSKLHAGDLYLGLACGLANEQALAILDREYVRELRPTLARMGLAANEIDETLQVMRAELLVPRGAAPPRILDYGGRGQLRGWLRSVAARTGLRTLKQTGRHIVLDDQHHAPTTGDLELEYMKKTYGEAFRRAFEVGLAALAEDDRLLLKQRFRHKLTVEELGELHSVHAGTISRWVVAARERLVKATRAEMQRALGVDRSDVSSIFRLIRSELEISLSVHSK